jgi:L-seryl-tRNA(Ser) seleniumtransferase
MKVGREEMVGMLVAVESWVRRDHAAEWKQWVARCDHIAERLSKVPGVTATVQREPQDSLSNRSPQVAVRWDSSRLGLTGPAVAALLYTGEPRITVGAGGGPSASIASGDTGISIVVSMMAAGDEKIVAQRAFQVLSAMHTLESAGPAAPPVTSVAGRWDVEIQYTASRATHTVHLHQNGNRLDGIHQGNFLSRDIAGTINGDIVSLSSNVTDRHGDALIYRFSGKVTAETMSGSLELGEYLGATWIARRPAAAARRLPG